MARELELNDARALEQEVQALTRQGAEDGVSGEEIQRLMKQSVEACESVSHGFAEESRQLIPRQSCRYKRRSTIETANIAAGLGRCRKGSR